MTGITRVDPCFRLRSSLLALGCALACAGSLAAAERMFEGTLVRKDGGKVVLRAEGKDYEFGAAREPWLLHSLHDKRLDGRAVRVEGELLPDGRVKVNHFWTVRDGRLYRVRYFCELCNIETLEPGICMCCQQETELQEIPSDEAKR
jgi:hypothetical protein